MMLMFDPPHPGETIKEDILPDLGLSVTEAAQQLGVSRTALSRVINGRAAMMGRQIRMRADNPLDCPPCWCGQWWCLPGVVVPVGAVKSCRW